MVELYFTSMLKRGSFVKPYATFAPNRCQNFIGDPSVIKISTLVRYKDNVHLLAICRTCFNPHVAEAYRQT